MTFLKSKLRQREKGTTLVDALMAEIEIENKIQKIVLRLLDKARDDSLNLKPRDKDDFVPKWERAENRRMWRSDLRRTLRKRGFTAKNFDQAITTLKNKGQVRVYGMTAADDTRHDVVALCLYKKKAAMGHEESREPGVTPGDVFRIFGNDARTWLTEENIREIGADNWAAIEEEAARWRKKSEPETE